jgi:hypothetical protein
LDIHRFDLLTKTLADAASRRSLMRLLAALPLGGFPVLLGEEGDATYTLSGK